MRSATFDLHMDCLPACNQHQTNVSQATNRKQNASVKILSLTYFLYSCADICLKRLVQSRYHQRPRKYNYCRPQGEKNIIQSLSVESPPAPPKASYNLSHSREVKLVTLFTAVILPFLAGS